MLIKDMDELKLFFQKMCFIVTEQFSKTAKIAIFLVLSRLKLFTILAK